MKTILKSQMICKLDSIVLVLLIKSLLYKIIVQKSTKSTCVHVRTLNKKRRT